MLVIDEIYVGNIFVTLVKVYFNNVDTDRVTML